MATSRNDHLLIKPYDHVKGTETSRHVLIEYGDHQCPYTVRAYRAIERTLAEFLGDIRFVFRNLPLRHLHPHAQLAATAAEAAGRQGRFWEMHEALMINHHRFGYETITDLAEQVGLDLPQFQDDFHSSDVLEKINADIESAKDLGIHKTPSFFLNGTYYQEEWRESGFKEQIADVLK